MPKRPALPQRQHTDEINRPSGTSGHPPRQTEPQGRARCLHHGCTWTQLTTIRQAHHTAAAHALATGHAAITQLPGQGNA